MRPKTNTYAVAYVEALKQRIEELEQRIEGMESAVKMARDDENWAIRNNVMFRSSVHSVGWEVGAGFLITSPYAEAPTIREALRAIRINVEGGAR